MKTPVRETKLTHDDMEALYLIIRERARARARDNISHALSRTRARALSLQGDQRREKGEGEETERRGRVKRLVRVKGGERRKKAGTGTGQYGTL